MEDYSAHIVYQYSLLSNPIDMVVFDFDIIHWLMGFGDASYSVSLHRKLV